jgi:hypothetical protein
MIPKQASPNDLQNKPSTSGKKETKTNKNSPDSKNAQERRTVNSNAK